MSFGMVESVLLVVVKFGEKKSSLW